MPFFALSVTHVQHLPLVQVVKSKTQVGKVVRVVSCAIGLSGECDMFE